MRRAAIFALKLLCFLASAASRSQSSSSSRRMVGPHASDVASAVEAAGDQPVSGTPSPEASGARSEQPSVCGAKAVSAPPEVGRPCAPTTMGGTAPLASGVPAATGVAPSMFAADSGTRNEELLEEGEMRCMLAAFAAASGSLAHVVAQALVGMRGGPRALASVTEVLLRLERPVSVVAGVLGEVRPELDALASAAPVASGLGSPFPLTLAAGGPMSTAPATPSPARSPAPFTPAAGGTPPPSPELDAALMAAVPQTPPARPPAVGAAHDDLPARGILGKGHRDLPQPHVVAAVQRAAPPPKRPCQCPRE